MENQNVTPILEIAWRKFAQYDATSVKRTAAYLRLRQWIAIFGLLATLFAILTAIYPANFSAVGEFVLKVLLISSPIIASLLAAFTNKFFITGDWLIARAGAEETLKDIYIYRTILQKNPKRREWLEKQLAKIQRSVYRGMNGELVMDAYKGETPPAPRFNPKAPNSDSGFHDLTGDEYFAFRLESELNWHIKKVNQKQKERTRLQLLILTSGALGAILAALGGPFTLWVALAASSTTTLLGWQELKNLDLVVRNYSKVIMELTIIADHWKNLEAEERTNSEFYKMVKSTEEILWSRHVEYIKAMQEALQESNLDEEARLINRIIDEQRDADRRLKQSREDAMTNIVAEQLEEGQETLSETFANALNNLAEEASSEIVQAELAAMRETLHNFAERLGLSSLLESIAEDYREVEISGQTPQSVLNDLLSRYPKTNEIKG